MTSDSVPCVGFWRRLAAFIVDGFVVLVPLQLATVVLFSLTDAKVQGSLLGTQQCEQVTHLPQGLDPPPFAGANWAAICKSSFFGFQTAHVLTVATVTQNGSTTKTISRSYTLDGEGRPNSAFVADWLAIVLLFAYVIPFETLRGATFGKSLVRIRTVVKKTPERIGLPLKTTLGREGAKLLGFIPGLMFPLMFLAGYGPDNPQWDEVFWPLSLCVLAVSFAWAAWIIADVVRKRDPIYDRLAGTAVLRKQ